jgi:hypothetical protein
MTSSRGAKRRGDPEAGRWIASPTARNDGFRLTLFIKGLTW